MFEWTDNAKVALTTSEYFDGVKSLIVLFQGCLMKAQNSPLPFDFKDVTLPAVNRLLQQLQQLRLWRQQCQLSHLRSVQ